MLQLRLVKFYVERDSMTECERDRQQPRWVLKGGKKRE